ncbi:2-phospho-L-lactate guanylyltransferase [Modestobacter roseus]|uniref:2-phospho-L-lactate guanylyltransferase n=1 Tax=Modestobacter roseus TaxID=1181884 RepID=UPI0034DE75C5
MHQWSVQQWSVVVPAKRLASAKTRLTPLTSGLGAAGTARHEELVLALLADTVAAALAADAVAGVLVVTDEPRAAAVVGALGAATVGDEPDRGLNAALAHGAAHARRTGATAVAALSSDLPALRPAELTAALRAAAAHPRAFAADAAGTGTTLLCAGPGAALDPRFGRASATAHAASGAVPLGGSWPGLRRDVDTPADLRSAARLGLGPRSTDLLSDTLWSPR